MTKTDGLESLLRGRKHALQDEWDRILKVPRIDEMDPKKVEWLHRDKSGQHRLRPVQMQALAMIQEYKGLFAPIGVGHGKTLIAWLAPVVLGNPRAVIMMPPPMVGPFKAEVDRHKHFYEQPVPEPAIVPYSILSSASGTDLLTRLRPEVIIADEGHALMHGTSARSKRLKRYFAENPNTIFITLSGTFFGDRPSDLAHLVQFSLGNNSFMPVRGRALEIWGECVNLKGRPGDSDWNSFTPLANAEGVRLDYYVGEERSKAARMAVYSRMKSAPGVVTTIEASIELPIHVHTHPEIEVPPEITAALERVLSDEETPDGEDIIVDDAQKARLQNHLSAGFFYRWAWEEIGGRDEEWLLARKVWGRALRKEIEHNSREGYDSELLVSTQVARELLADPSLADSSILHNAWGEWVPHKVKKAPPTRAVWVSDFYVQWIKEFLSDGVPTVVWYSSHGLEAALIEAGIPTYGRGTEVPEFSGQSVACSIRVHGEGKNGFQPWSRMLVAEPPSKAKTWEQLIGRHHRPGQKAPVVEVHVPIHTSKFRKCLDDAVKGAYHTQELSKVDQRLLLARYIGEYE